MEEHSSSNRADYIAIIVSFFSLVISYCAYEEAINQRKSNIRPELFAAPYSYSNVCVQTEDTLPLLFGGYVCAENCEIDVFNTSEKIKTNRVGCQFMYQIFNQGSGTAKNIVYSWYFDTVAVKRYTNSIFKQVKISFKPKSYSVEFKDIGSYGPRESVDTSKQTFLATNNGITTRLPEDYTRFFLGAVTTKYGGLGDGFPLLFLDLQYQDIEDKVFYKRFSIRPKCRFMKMTDKSYSFALDFETSEVQFVRAEQKKGPVIGPPKVPR